MPLHSVWSARFPCQEYSVAETLSPGHRRRKCVLWWQICRTAPSEAYDDALSKRTGPGVTAVLVAAISFVLASAELDLVPESVARDVPPTTAAAEAQASTSAVARWSSPSFRGPRSRRRPAKALPVIDASTGRSSGLRAASGDEADVTSAFRSIKEHHRSGTPTTWRAPRSGPVMSGRRTSGRDDAR